MKILQFFSNFRIFYVLKKSGNQEKSWKFSPLKSAGLLDKEKSAGLLDSDWENKSDLGPQKIKQSIY